MGDVINQALEQSSHLIVVCSSRSAKSQWINKEVKEFKRLGKADRILCLIVDGEPNAADAREGKDEKANALLKLVAGLLGVGFDELKQRDAVRRQKRMAMVAGVSVALMAGDDGI